MITIAQIASSWTHS